jgi:hypothetical protein
MPYWPGCPVRHPKDHPAQDSRRARRLLPPSPQPQLIPGRLQAALGASRGTVVTFRSETSPKHGGPLTERRAGRNLPRAAEGPGTRHRQTLARRMGAGCSPKCPTEVQPDPWPPRGTIRWPSQGPIHDPATTRCGNAQEARKEGWPSGGCDSRRLERVPPPSRTHGDHGHGPVAVQQRDLYQSSAIHPFPCTASQAERRDPCLSLALVLDPRLDPQVPITPARVNS